MGRCGYDQHIFVGDDDAFGRSVSGQIEIDVTTGVAGYGSFTLYPHQPNGSFPNEAVPFNAFFESGCLGCGEEGETTTVVIAAEDNNNDLIIEIVADTLVGFTGAPLCGPAGRCNGGGATSEFILNLPHIGQDTEALVPGALVLVSSVTTPEPSSVALLMTGLLGLGGHVRRRLRKQNTVSEDGAA